MSMGLRKIQVNTSGSWANLVIFQEEKFPEMKAACMLLSEASIQSCKFRVFTMETGHCEEFGSFRKGSK